MANNIIDLTSDDESGDPPPQAPTADLDDNPLPQEPAADDEDDSGDDDDNPLPQEPVADDEDDSGDDNDNPLPQEPAADSDSDSQPRGAVYKMWMFCDVKLMLTTLADERRRSGELLSTQDLFNALRGKLERKDAKVQDVSNKISNLKKKFQKANEKGGPGKKDIDRRLFELSKPVWPELLLVGKDVPVIVID